ncbi:MAG: hypothetical protein AAGC85_24220, partial [Bacteroidota bacterium]
LGCNNPRDKDSINSMGSYDLEELAFEGLKVDFQFNSTKPTFGDLFLIVGLENPNFPPNSREFEQLSNLGFKQTDDYFSISNSTDPENHQEVWLFPVVNEEEAFHHPGPFDAVRLNYSIVWNQPETEKIFKEAYSAIINSLDVTPKIGGKSIKSYAEISSIIEKTITYCRVELKVEPGSKEALELEW